MKKLLIATAAVVLLASAAPALAESGLGQCCDDYNWGGGSSSSKSNSGSKGGSKNEKLGSDNAVLTNIATKKDGDPKNKPADRSVTAYAKAKHKDATEADFRTITTRGNSYRSQPVSRSGDGYTKGSPSSSGGRNASGCCY